MNASKEARRDQAPFGLDATALVVAGLEDPMGPSASVLAKSSPAVWHRAAETLREITTQGGEPAVHTLGFVLEVLGAVADGSARCRECEALLGEALNGVLDCGHVAQAAKIIAHAGSPAFERAVHTVRDADRAHLLEAVARHVPLARRVVVVRELAHVDAVTRLGMLAEPALAPHLSRIQR